MILTTGAQRVKYLEINIKEINEIKKAYNLETNEEYLETLELYYYVYDENHNAYDTPKIDNVDNYMLVLNDDNEIKLNDYLKNSNYYSNYYVIISNHNKISSIEHFKVNNHDKFYAIQINEDVANFLYTVGIENVSVQEHSREYWNDNYYLPTITIKSGYELLFFLTTENEIIKSEIYYLRGEIISNNLKQMIRNKISQGLLFVLEDNSIVHLTYTLKDKLELEKSRKLKLNALINNGVAYIVSSNDLNNIFEALDKNENNYKLYLSEALDTHLGYWANWREWGEM